MPIVGAPIGGFSVDAELIDNISSKLDNIDRELDDITSRRLARERAAGSASQDAARTAAMGWTEFRSAYSTVLDVVQVGRQIWQATGQEFVNYAEQVKNMSRALGASAEETSRIIQVADDVRISYDNLKIAMKEARKDGIEPNIENLAKLADQYKAIQSPAERTKFLLETFGKSGLEMGKLMERGGDGIRAMSDAIDESLIMTEKGIKASDDYQRSLDDLNDSFLGVKIAVGGELVPVMNAFMRIVLADIEAVGVFRDVLAGDKSLAEAAGEVADIINDNGFEVFGFQIGNIAESTEESTDAFYENSEAVDTQKEALKAAEQALKDYKDELEAVSKANQDAEKFLQNYADFQKGYEEDHEDAVNKIAEAEEKLRRAQNKDYGKGKNADENRKNAINDAKEALAEARAEIQELEAQWHESTNKMIYDMVLAKVSVDGLTDAEFKATQQLAVQMGIRTQAQADEAIEMMEKATAIADGIALQEDVMREKNEQDAKMLELEAAKEAAAAQTTQTMVDGNNAAAQSEQALAASVDATTLALGRQADAARKAAEAMMYANAAAPNTGTTATNKGGRGGGGGKKHEFGGEFIVPPQYGREGFALGDYGTASAGEKITITPPGKSTGGVYNIVINNPKREAAEDTLRAFFSKMRYLGVAV